MAKPATYFGGCLSAGASFSSVPCILKCNLNNSLMREQRSLLSSPCCRGERSNGKDPSGTLKIQTNTPLMHLQPILKKCFAPQLQWSPSMTNSSDYGKRICLCTITPWHSERSPLPSDGTKLLSSLHFIMVWVLHFMNKLSFMRIKWDWRISCKKALQVSQHLTTCHTEESSPPATISPAPEAM